ncbi:chaperonin 10-like protein [Gongronella butleri]|nr:chaperonin 10-like protein [Gongronella butleri]
MEAITFVEPRKVALTHVDKPTLEEPTDAIVKVTLAGLCGSDIHPYLGHKEGLAPGTITGHEFVGVVESLGNDVKGLQVGDRVASSFTSACGECWFCRNGISCRCEKGQLFGWLSTSTGKGIHGGQAQFVRVPLAGSTLIKLPDTVNDKAALLLGDIFPTGYYCASSGLRVLQADGCKTEDLTVVLVGCGPVGIMALFAAQYLGIKTVYASDLSEERLAVAVKNGATAIHFDQADPIAAVKAINGIGADLVLECVGHPSATDVAFKIVRPGGVISSIGVQGTHTKFPFTPENAYDKNITYRTGRCPARSLMPELLERLSTQTIDITSVFTHVVPLKDAPEMYTSFANREPGIFKVAMDPWM